MSSRRKWTRRVFVLLAIISVGWFVINQIESFRWSERCVAAGGRVCIILSIGTVLFIFLRPVVFAISGVTEKLMPWADAEVQTHVIFVFLASAIIIGFYWAFYSLLTWIFGTSQRDRQ